MPDPINNSQFKRFDPSLLESDTSKIPNYVQVHKFDPTLLKPEEPKEKTIGDRIEFQAASLQNFIIPTLAQFVSVALPKVEQSLVTALFMGEKGREFAKMNMSQIYPDWVELRKNNQLLIEEYDPHVLESGIALALGVAADAPVFSGFGKVGMSLPKLATSMSGWLTKKGVSKVAAEKIVTKGVEEIAKQQAKLGVGAEIAGRIGHGAGALGGHGATFDFLRQVGEGKSFDEIETNSIIREGGHGALLGAAAAAVAIPFSATLRPVSEALAKKGQFARRLATSAIKNTSTAAEAAVFTVGGNMLTPEEFREPLTWEDFYHGFIEFRILKASHIKGFMNDPISKINFKYEAIKKIRNNNITPEELASVKMGELSQLEAKIFDGDFIAAAMRSKNVPATLKVKLADALSPGVDKRELPDLKKSSNRTEYEESPDGRFYVNTRDESGWLLERTEFDTAEKAMTAASDVTAFQNTNKLKEHFNSLRKQTGSEEKLIEEINSELRDDKHNGKGKIVEDIGEFFNGELTNLPFSEMTAEQRSRLAKGKEIIEKHLDGVKNEIKEKVDEIEKVNQKVISVKESILKDVTSEIDEIKNKPETEKISKSERKKLTELESKKSDLEADIKLLKDRSLQKVETDLNQERRNLENIAAKTPKGEVISDEEYENFTGKDYVGERRQIEIEEKLRKGERLTPREREIAVKRLPEALAKAEIEKPIEIKEQGKIPPVRLSAKTGSQKVSSRGLGKRVVTSKPTSDERSEGFEKRITIIDDDTKTVRTYLTKKGFDTEFKAIEKQYGKQKGADFYMTPKQVSDYNAALDKAHKAKPYEQVEVTLETVSEAPEKTKTTPAKKASAKPAMVDVKKNDIVNLGHDKTYQVEEVKGDVVTLMDFETGNTRQVHRSKIKGLGEKVTEVAEPVEKKPAVPKAKTEKPKAEPVKEEPETVVPEKTVKEPKPKPEKEKVNVKEGTKNASKTGKSTSASGTAQGAKGRKSGSVRVRDTAKDRLEAQQRERERLNKMISDVAEQTRTNKDHIRKTFDMFRDIWDFSEDKAAASAVVYDILVETLSIRSGIPKADLWKRITHSKDVEEFKKMLRSKSIDIKYQLIPETANLTDIDKKSLAEAKKMYAENKSPEQIRITTGWELLPVSDKKSVWFMETKPLDVLKSDILSAYDIAVVKHKQELANIKRLNLKRKPKDQVKEEEFSLPLSALVSPLDPIWTYFPDAANIRVIFDPSILDQKAAGTYNSSTGDITVALTYPKELYRTSKIQDLVHEVQHFIQYRSGLPGGGSPKNVHRLIDPEKLTDMDIKTIFSRLVEKNESMSFSEAEKGINDFIDWWKKFKEYAIDHLAFENKVNKETEKLIKDLNFKLMLINRQISDIQGVVSGQIKFGHGAFGFKNDLKQLRASKKSLMDILANVDEIRLDAINNVKKNTNLYDILETSKAIHQAAKLNTETEDKVRTAIYDALWGEVNAVDAEMRAGRWLTGDPYVSRTIFGKPKFSRGGNVNYQKTLIKESPEWGMQDLYFQKGSKNKKDISRAAVAMLRDGRNIIYALSSPIPSSPLHELVHIWEKYLDPAERSTVLGWSNSMRGLKEGEWSKNTTEDFAYGFEKFLMDGKAPNPRLEGVFAKFKNWLSEIYSKVTNSVSGMVLNEGMIDLYSKMLSPEAMLYDKKKIEESLDIKDGKIIWQKDVTTAAVEQKIRNLLDEKQKKLDEDLRKFEDDLRKTDEEGSFIEVDVNGEQRAFRVRIKDGKFKVSSAWDRTTAVVNGKEIEKLKPVQDKDLKKRIIEEFKAKTEPVIAEKRKMFMDELSSIYMEEIRNEIETYVRQRNEALPEEPTGYLMTPPIKDTKPSEGKARKIPLPSAGDREVVDVAKALKDEIRMLASTAKEVKKVTDKSFKDISSEIRKKIIEARDKKHISVGQYLSLIGRLGNANTMKRIMSLVERQYTIYDPSNMDVRGRRKPVAEYLVPKIIDEYEVIRGRFEENYKRLIEDPIELAKELHRLDSQEIPIVYKGTLYNVSRGSSYIDKVLDSSYWKALDIDAKNIISKVSSSNKVGKSRFGNATELAELIKKMDLNQFTIEELEEFVREGNKMLKNSKTPSISNLEYLVTKYLDRVKIKKEQEGIVTYEDLLDMIEGKFNEFGELDKPGVKQFVEDFFMKEPSEVVAREYMNVMRRITMARHKAYDLFERGALTETQLKDIEDLIGTFSQEMSPKKGVYQEMMDAVKQSYIDNILEMRVDPEVRASVDNNFGEIMRKWLNEFLTVKQEELNRLEFSDVEAYNETVLNLKKGYVTPSIGQLKAELRAFELHDAYLKKALQNIYKSKAWEDLRKNDFQTKKEKAIQDIDFAIQKAFRRDPKAIESALLRKLLSEWKSHRIDTLFGNFDKYSRIGAIYEIAGRSMIQADKIRSKYDKMFYDAYGKFEKENRWIPIRNRKLSLMGLILTEQRLQSSAQFKNLVSSGLITQDLASVADYDYRLHPKQQARGVGILSLFGRNQSVWNELRERLISEGAYETVIGKNGVEVKILDMKRAEEIAREDSGIAMMMDVTRQILSDMKEIAEVATMDNNRTFYDSENYYPFYSYSQRSEMRNEDVINMINRGYADVMLQAGSTRPIMYKQKLLDLSPASVIPRYINEISRNYALRPELMASRRALRYAVDEFVRENTEKSGSEFDSKFIPQMMDIINTDLMDRIRFQYKAGRYAEYPSVSRKIWNKVMKASKKFLLANIQRIAPEYTSNLLRAYLSTHNNLMKSSELLALDNNVFTEIITDYIGSRYMSQYSSEWGDKFARNKGIHKLEAAMDWIITFSDTSVGRPLFVYEFTKSFEELSGKKFDDKLYATNEEYKIDNRLFIEKSALVALRKVEELFNDKNPLTSGTKTRFFGGLISAQNDKVATQIFDYLQSFNRNELDQLWDSARRRRFSDSIEDRIQGIRDMNAIMFSNALYNIFRMFISVGAMRVFSDKDDEFAKKKWDEFIMNWGWAKRGLAAASTPMIGGNINIYKIPIQWALFAARDIDAIDDKKLAALEEWLDRDVYIRKIPKGGSTEQIMTATFPVPSELVKDPFRAMDDFSSFINGMQEHGFTDDEAVRMLDLMFRGMKYAIPNPANIMITRWTEKEIRRIKTEEKAREKAKKNKKPGDKSWASD